MDSLSLFNSSFTHHTHFDCSSKSLSPIHHSHSLVYIQLNYCCWFQVWWCQSASNHTLFMHASAHLIYFPYPQAELTITFSYQYQMLKYVLMLYSQPCLQSPQAFVKSTTIWECSTSTSAWLSMQCFYLHCYNHHCFVPLSCINSVCIAIAGIYWLYCIVSELCLFWIVLCASSHGLVCIKYQMNISKCRVLWLELGFEFRLYCLGWGWTLHSVFTAQHFIEFILKYTIPMNVNNNSYANVGQINDNTTMIHNKQCWSSPINWHLQQIMIDIPTQPQYSCSVENIQ